MDVMGGIQNILYRCKGQKKILQNGQGGYKETEIRIFWKENNYFVKEN